MREPLVGERVDHLRRRKQHERAERVACAGEHAVVEIRQRNDERDVVLGDERRESGDVARIVDARHECVRVGVVQRRRERVDVDRDRRRARATERRDDVDALARAREEDADAGHGPRGYREHGSRLGR